LIELLVVISIIALLISILLPSLTQAREQAKSTVCKTNLKAVGTALGTYLTDNNGYYPGEHHTSPRTDTFVWPGRLRHEAGGVTGVFNCPSVDEEFDWIKTLGFTGNVDPTRWWYDRGEFPIQNRTFFSYGYNGWGIREFSAMREGGRHLGLGGHVDMNERYDWDEPPEITIKVASDMIAIADTFTNGIYDGSIIPYQHGAASNRWPSKRHYGGSNVLFCDTHVEYNKQANLIAETRPARRRWNSDHLPHEELWAP